MIPASRLLLLLGWCLILSGCGGPRKVPVAGRVFYKGKALAAATVTFHAEGGAGGVAHSVTDDDGYYSLSSKEDDDGVMPGSYKITVGKYNRIAKPPVTPEEYVRMQKDEAFKKSLALSESQIPAVYADPSRTPLRVEVPKGGTENLDIQLNEKGS